MERVTDDDGPFDDDGVVTVTLPRTHFCITARIVEAPHAHTSDTDITSSRRHFTPLFFSVDLEFRFHDVVRAMFENGDDDDDVGSRCKHRRRRRASIVIVAR